MAILHSRPHGLRMRPFNGVAAQRDSVRAACLNSTVLHGSLTRIATLPPRLSFADPGSFAAVTLRERLPKIVDLVVAAVGEEAPFNERVAALRRSLAGGAPPETLGIGEERAFWNDFMSAYRGARWAELPFFEGEFMLYRAILDAVEYEQRGVDPFELVKSEALAKAALSLARVAEDASQIEGWSQAALGRALARSLNGNSADLSQLLSGARGAPRRPWVEDSRAFFEELSPDKAANVELVLDNNGEELFGDLVLVDYLLRALPLLVLRIHVKPAPIFVSDVTLSDWRSSLELLTAHASPEVSAWGARLREQEREGRLQLHADPFWIRPLCFFQMTGTLRDQFAGATAILIKGDLNYRRYVQDRRWPLDSPMERHRLPDLAPVLALRVLKSELAVGLPPETVAHLQHEEPDGLHNGKNSVIQYFR